MSLPENSAGGAFRAPPANSRPFGEIAGYFAVESRRVLILSQVKAAQMRKQFLLVDSCRLNRGSVRGCAADFWEKVAAVCRIGRAAVGLGMETLIKGKDLTKEAPRSPKMKLGGYVILARTLDKCRALIGGDIGEYHFDCPLDNQLFGFKGIKGDDFKAAVEKGASDEEMVQWVDAHGEPKTEEQKQAWVAERMKYSMYNDPEKRDFFIEETKKLGLDPATTTLFEWLDADDKASH